MRASCTTSDGGWIWVIPFDNREGSESDLVSVGLNLDCALPEAARRYGRRRMAGVPALAAGHRRAVRGRRDRLSLDSTERTQFSSTETVGDRWVLMAHAAGAIDALFGRGMANTMAAPMAALAALVAGLALVHLLLTRCERSGLLDRLHPTTLIGGVLVAITASAVASDTAGLHTVVGPLLLGAAAQRPPRRDAGRHPRACGTRGAAAVLLSHGRVGCRRVFGGPALGDGPSAGRGGCGQAGRRLGRRVPPA